MAKKFDEQERLRCMDALRVCQKKRMSIREMARHIGVSRSYIHRLTVQMGVSCGAMHSATERRKEAGWEPLAPGSAISCEAIGLKSFGFSSASR
ncbi:helix-turn-helix domain-containing protein [Acetobacter estunensis]|nr:helix-turn-helix domain-containing protein [Acetobacter estunensis]MBV1838654.1 helix-turn-helix domain-containing protein [Acetobacter estunensis]